MVADISGLNWFMPIFGFMFVFLVVYVVLKKIDLFKDNGFITIFTSFIIATMFATVSSMRKYIETATPWVVVLIFVLFFVLLLLNMTKADISKILGNPAGWALVIAVIAIFLISATAVFPGFSELIEKIVDYIKTEERVAGTALLIIIAAVVSFVIAKK